ncbi:phage-shock protein [Thermodesulfobacteriota bacterium]
MHGAMILAIIFGGTVLILAIIGSTILMAIKIIRGGLSRKGQKTQTDEARMIQEIYQGISKMEERIEALETLILDRDRKESEQ